MRSSITTALQPGWTNPARENASLPKPLAWPLERKQELGELFVKTTEQWSAAAFPARLLPASLALVGATMAGSQVLDALLALTESLGAAAGFGALGAGVVAGVGALVFGPKVQRAAGTLGQSLAPRLGLSRRHGDLLGRGLALAAMTGLALIAPAGIPATVAGLSLLGLGHRLADAGQKNSRRETGDGLDFGKVLQVEAAARTHEMTSLAAELSPEELGQAQQAVGSLKNDWAAWAGALACQSGDRLHQHGVTDTTDVTPEQLERPALRRDLKLHHSALAYLGTSGLLAEMATMGIARIIPADIALRETLCRAPADWRERAETTAAALADRYAESRSGNLQKVAESARTLAEILTSESLLAEKL